MPHGTLEKVPRRVSRERKREGGERQVVKCLELTPAESIQDVIQKIKKGVVG